MKKGFTLIELLAVIIILAIIALIATPIILNVVDDAKKSAAESEANMIVSGINNNCAIKDMQVQMGVSGASACGPSLGTSDVQELVDLGKASITGSVTLENGRVTGITVVSNGYTVTMTDGSWADPTK